MGSGGGSGEAASSGGEFQTARQGFVLIFVLHGSCVFFVRPRVSGSQPFVGN